MCPLGHYCPQGSTNPTVCPAGNYSSTPGSISCPPCPAGRYCPEGTEDPNENICPRGYYCPQSTPTADAFPCPQGTFNNVTGSVSVTACLQCQNGTYCESEGLTSYTGMCIAGYYCSQGSSTPNPSRFTTVGGPCPVGFYCPEGTPSPVSCPPGSYCDRELLSIPAGICQAGYYCTGEASRSDPTDGITGDTCPTGSFCPPNASYPFLCPIGTFSNNTGNGDVTDCQQCTPGYYCSDLGQFMVTNRCDAGYYCPGGERVASLPTIFVLKALLSSWICATYQMLTRNLSR